MTKWDELFKAKLWEVMSSKSKWNIFASMSPRANGSCAREQIAEEYYAQQAEIIQLKTALTQCEYRSKQWEERFSSGRLT